MKRNFQRVSSMAAFPRLGRVFLFAAVVSTAAALLFGCGDSGNGAGPKEERYSVTVLSDGTGSSGANTYKAGDTVAINSGTPPANQRFKGWTTASGVTFADSAKPQTTFTMPAKEVTVTAVFGPNTFTVTVESKGTDPSGNGEYASGAMVTINCGKAPADQRFKNWTTATADVTFGSATNTQTTFIMPPADVTVTAEFESSIFTDPRDGKLYKSVKIGNQTWMAQNLYYAINETDVISKCYFGNTPDSCKKYGLLYDWTTAKTVCPTGWHLPSDVEWQSLTDHIGSSIAGKQLKAKTPDWDGTDEYGFTALPGGRRESNGATSSAGTSGYWWTSTDVGGGAEAISQSISTNGNNVSKPTINKSVGFSVRCIME